jgi:hypothetical protein
MLITLIAGDHDWSVEGTHVLDGNGFAISLAEGKEVEVSDEVHARIMPIIEGTRVYRGLNPDGTVPVPEPEPIPEPAPEPEPTPEEP